MNTIEKLKVTAFYEMERAYSCASLCLTIFKNISDKKNR